MYRNTIGAFYALLYKEIDIFFGVAPDAWLKAEAVEIFGREPELVYTPLGREAFVFFTHKDNPVNSLTRAQLKDIYAGRITNWKDVGGLDQPILAFQRNQGSGSQAALERFMGETPLAEPPTELRSGAMEGIVLEVARYRSVPNALGYTFYSFATQLAANENVKLLRVDGVAPSLDSIRDRNYPVLETRLAITLKENTKPAVARFLEWMQGPQGQKLIRDMGRVGNED
jgi:phosphate transport system substrate-binding protein